MHAAIISHRVADFDTWLKAYREHAGLRISSGLAGGIVYQEKGDPNSVHIVFKDVDIDAFNAFLADPKLVSAMMVAGVDGPPKVMILENGGVFDG